MSEIVICAIAKYENKYILEWIDYHLNLGFTKIYLFDNNDTEGERIVDVVNQYNYSGKVEIIDVRGQKYVQKKVYNDFYYQYSFDWCAFIDLDEFITFNPESNFDNIQSFIKTVQNFDCIHINWMCYGDNGHIRYKRGSVIERFPKPIKPFWKTQRTDLIPLNSAIKSILKSNCEINWEQDTEKWNSNPHTPYGEIRICDDCNNKIVNSPFKNYSFVNIYIRHYYTKSLEEFLVKITRQCADIDANNYYSINKFFRINSITISKLTFLFLQNRTFKFNDLRLIMDIINSHARFKLKIIYLKLKWKRKIF